MARFEDLQTLWQQQPVRTLAAPQAAELTAAFRRYGRRHDLINLAKLLVISLQMAILTNALRHRPTILFGACLAVFSSLLFLFRDWRDQRAVARLNFAEPSTEFLHNAIARLNAQRDPFRKREFYIAMGGAFIGLNLMFESWVGHLSTLAMPFLIYRLGRFVRDRRFRREAQPLIDRMSAVLETMEGDHA
uniref:Uncharacterized protein n=1 Tax=Solibacter usitatus (strain Ellin6076) TaxID=234267 RepID=Q024V6_SOLUE